MTDTVDLPSQLSAAVENGNLELIKSLVAQKADPNACIESPLITVLQEHELSFKSMMILEFLVKTGRADLTKKSISTGETALEIAQKIFEPLSPRKADPLVVSTLTLLGESPKPQTPPSSPPKPVKRTEAMNKLLNMHIPDIRKPVPYRESSSVLSPTQQVSPSPHVPSTTVSTTVDNTGEILSLRAENEALKSEISRLRSLLNQTNPEEQLKKLYARLVQIEAIENQLNNISI